MHKTNSQRERARKFIRAVLGTILGPVLHTGVPGRRPLAGSASPYAYLVRYLHGEGYPQTLKEAHRFRNRLIVPRSEMHRFPGLYCQQPMHRFGVYIHVSTDNTFCTNSQSFLIKPSERWRTIWRMRLAERRRLRRDVNEVLETPKRRQSGAGVHFLFRTLTLQLFLPGPLLSSLHTDVSQGSSHLRHLDTTNAVVPGVSLCVSVCVSVFVRTRQIMSLDIY